MVFPSTLPRAHAVLSNGNNYFAAYGPNIDNLLYTVYVDFGTMFTAFSAGSLDYTDWPVQPDDLANYIGNNDFFVTCHSAGTQCGGEAEFGTFQLDINYGNPLLGTGTVDTWQTARGTLANPSVVAVSTGGVCSPACPTSTFQLTIQLQNLEEGNAAVKDSNNRVQAWITGTAQPSPTSGTLDNGGASPTGSYALGFLSDAAGIVSYNLATTIYSGVATLSASACAAQTACTFALRVNYNSGSTLKPSAGGIALNRALWHMLNKPQYLTGPYLTPAGGAPLGACMDVFAPPSQALMAGGVGGCDHSSSVPNSVLTAECSDANIAALLTASGLSCAPSSLYVLKSNVVNGAASCAAGTVGISCFPSQSASPPTGYPSNIDLAAACIYFVEANFATTATGTTVQQCQAVAAGTAHLVNPNGSCNTTTAAGCVTMYIRTHPPRQAFGTIVADTINYLFGTAGANGGTVCYGGPPSLSCSRTPVYFTISQVADIVFDTSVQKDWNLYTGGNGFGSTPDGNLYQVPNGDFAGTYCNPNAVPNTGPNDYNLFCSPKLDTQSNAGEFIPGITFPAFQQAAIIGATEGMNMPVYSGANFFVALNSWSHQQVTPGTGYGVVTTKGHGIEAGYTNLMDAQPVHGYVPSNSLFYASGCNPSTGAGCPQINGSPCSPSAGTCLQNTMRRGLSQTTSHLSPYVFDTVWEAEILNQVYDSMLAVNPNTGGLCQTQPGGASQCIDWMTTSHSELQNSPAAGQTTWTWNLRQDIFFTDGQPVTAHDVCFSVLSDRDAPSRLLASSVADVISCTTIGTRTAQIVVSGLSSFDELNLGGIFIVPEHVWAPLCGGLKTGTDACVTPSNLASRTFDPIAAGDMVGSGPWYCNSSVGVSTIAGQASCTQNANGSPGGQALGAGARVLMKRNLSYMRCCPDIQTPATPWLGTANFGTNLQALEWADGFNYGKVTISDIALAASVFGFAGNSTATTSGATAAHYASPLYSATPSSDTVDIGDIAVAAYYFDHGLTAPFLGTQQRPFNPAAPPGLTQYTPNSDPYLLAANPLFWGGSTRARGELFTMACNFVAGPGVSSPGCPVATATTHYTAETHTVKSVATNIGAEPNQVCAEPVGTVHSTAQNVWTGPGKFAQQYIPPLVSGCLYQVVMTVDGTPNIRTETA